MRALLTLAAMTIAVLSGAAAAPAHAAAPSAAPPAPAAPKLEKLSWGSVEQMHRSGEIYLATQPSKEDLDLAKESGIRTVVSLRKPDEIDWNERAAVESLGMAYDSFPFQTPEELTDAVLDRVRRVLSSSPAKPILLHCASANRVGAVWLAHRVLDDAVAYPEALAEAETVGLKSAAFRDRVKSYIDARRPR